MTTFRFAESKIEKKKERKIKTQEKMGKWKKKRE